MWCVLNVRGSCSHSVGFVWLYYDVTIVYCDMIYYNIRSFTIRHTLRTSLRVLQSFCGRESKDEMDRTSRFQSY